MAEKTTGDSNFETIRRINELQREYFNRRVNVFEPPLPEGVPERLKEIVAAGQIGPGDAVLDVGTGSGILIPYMLDYNPSEVHACDLAENMLQRVKEKFPGAALLEIDLKTGRTHQIRVHCQAMGYPIVGDQQYGQRRARMHLARHDPQLYPVADLVRRQMLHAARLGFSHPITGQLMIFEAALPQDMADVIMALRNLIAEA